MFRTKVSVNLIDLDMSLMSFKKNISPKTEKLGRIYSHKLSVNVSADDKSTKIVGSVRSVFLRLLEKASLLDLLL